MGQDVEAIVGWGSRCSTRPQPVDDAGVEPGGRRSGWRWAPRRERGRDKLTLVAARRCSSRSASGSSSSSPKAPASRAWASCRLPASRIGAPDAYGTDRLFVHVRSGSGDETHAERGRRPAGRRRADRDDRRRRSQRRSAPSSCAGRSRRQSPARSSASTRSTSRTSSRRRTRRGSCSKDTRQPARLPADARRCDSGRRAG